ncbi:MAG: hypothetical protein ONB06_09820 [candidate division KSB1 bacterium]|nr:hypothetical protein [candidate division KSB1 bacterium]
MALYSEVGGSPVEKLTVEGRAVVERTFVCNWADRYTVARMAFDGELSTYRWSGPLNGVLLAGDIDILPLGKCIDANGNYEQATIHVVYRQWEVKPLGPAFHESLVPSIRPTNIPRHLLYFKYTDEAGRLHYASAGEIEPITESGADYVLTYSGLLDIPANFINLLNYANSQPLTIMGGRVGVAAECMLYSGLNVTRSWMLATIPKWNATLTFTLRNYSWNQAYNPVLNGYDYRYLRVPKRRTEEFRLYYPHPLADLRVLLP